MAISKNDVLRVAHLTRLDLTQEELELFSEQLESVLAFIDKLKQLDVSQVKPMSHVLDIKDVLREDIQQASLNKDEVLKNSPLSLRGHFQVPKVIE